MPEVALTVLTWPREVLADLIGQGGPWVVWIFLCGFVMWTLVVERTWYFSRVLPRQTRACW